MKSVVSGDNTGQTSSPSQKILSSELVESRAKCLKRQSKIKFLFMQSALDIPNEIDVFGL